MDATMVGGACADFAVCSWIADAELAVKSRPSTPDEPPVASFSYVYASNFSAHATKSYETPSNVSDRSGSDFTSVSSPPRDSSMRTSSSSGCSASPSERKT